MSEVTPSREGLFGFGRLRQRATSPVSSTCGTRNVTIRSLTPEDGEAIAALLTASRSVYTRFFRPFAYEANVISSLVSRSRKDQFFALVLNGSGAPECVGVYLLRGLDDAPPEPAFSVFIAERCAGMGLARLCLLHAEAFCRLNAIAHLQAAIDPLATRALSIFNREDYLFLRKDPRTGATILRRDLRLSAPIPR